MLREDILSKINSGNYSFLQSSPELQSLIYLAASGSYGYGTHNDESDLDLRGVAIEPVECLFGLGDFEQFESQETDTVIYGLKKFTRLCLCANPNMLELLGLDEDCVAFTSESFELLRANSHLFLSRAVIKSFGNYALSQLRRLKNALARSEDNSEALEMHLLETMNSLKDKFNERYAHMEGGFINLRLAESKKKDLSQEIIMDISLKNYPLRDFAFEYENLSSLLHSYNKLRHRNRKKDDKHLFKHAMHLIRLLLTGIDILDGKGIITRRSGDLELLSNIRNGSFSFEEIFLIVDECQERFEDSAKRTKLPGCPDEPAVVKLIKKIYIDCFNFAGTQPHPR
ncbi:MAG: nucleotidyltransferase domain-containing protein [Clostridiales bacterium]|jgi:predicted nucleotidyltransferase|nr:nucleotidyltransferase domain-containing protein [Clostridiales bacterium]